MSHHHPDLARRRFTRLGLPLIWRLRTYAVGLFALCLTGGTAADPAAAPVMTEQRVERTELRTIGLNYLLALPEGYDDDPQRSWPLVLFLHGAGERGDDLEQVKVNGPPRLIADGQKIDAIVVSPQCPADSWWDAHLDALTLLLDTVEADHRVDPDRVYLTGLSMGGYGTWALAGAMPERFAAAVPICGGGSRWSAMRIGRAKLPLWCFHGEDDAVVLVEESQRMMRWVSGTGHTAARLTVYPGVNHDSWTRTYADPALWEWLFAQKRTPPGVNPAE